MRSHIKVLVLALCIAACSPLALGDQALTLRPRPQYSTVVKHFTSTWQRPPKSSDLEETDPRLTLKGFYAEESTGPEQVHIAFAGSDGMTVSWVTSEANTDTRVFFGTSPDALTSVAVGTNATYSCKKSSTYGGCPSDYTSGVIHHAVLTPLKPATRYFYSIGPPKAEVNEAPTDRLEALRQSLLTPLITLTNFFGWISGGPVSSSFTAFKANFTTPPPPGPASLPMNYSLIGDLGQTANSLDTVHHLIASADPVIVHVGDLSYADGYQPRWDTYANMVQPLASLVPWMTVEGNHEIEAGLSVPFLAYTTRYHMTAGETMTPGETMPPGKTTLTSTDPNPSKPSSLYYSFVHGAATWLMLGSYVDYASSSNQYKWLQQQLAAIDRSVTPWVFVGLHAPWYNSNHVHQGEGEGMRKSMESLLYGAGVDAVFSGHVHAYERCERVYNFKVNQCGPTYINIGDGGNREGLAEPWMKPQPDWSAFRESSYGHGTLSVVNTTHAHWSWYRNQDQDTKVSDAVWIVKPSPSACSNTIDIVA